MDAKESLEIRTQMAEMHEIFIEKMSCAYDQKHYVETVWYCYAIFEQRVCRLISKYIDKCNLSPERCDEKTVAISTRITCIKKMINHKYACFDSFKIDLFDRILNWCDKRNDLVHGLISLNHYKEFDKEFELLALEGVELVFELYDACTDFRELWYKQENVEIEFPITKCKCKNKKCINSNKVW